MMSEVAIVGAGPAGACAAYTLARKGARVTILDASHPREKPCGGGVTGRALEVVSDVVDVTRLPTRTISRVRFTSSGNRASAVVDLSGASPGQRGATTPEGPGIPGIVVASRVAFDATLLEAARDAGASLVEARVTDVVRESGGFRLVTASGTYRTSFVVGADGANSLVRRRLSRPFLRDELSIATGYFAHGVTSDEIIIELTTTPPGYIWSFPRPDHLAIGICAQADAGYPAGDLRERTAAWITNTNIAAGARLEPYAWPIPSLGAASLDRLELGGHGWCVVGDAAGLVDPITREGIFYALLSGRAIGEVLISGADPREYAARVRDLIVPELRKAARVKATFFRPAFTALLLRWLEQSASIRATMADLITGRQTYAGLKWRLLKMLEARLGWQALTRLRRLE